MVFGLTTTSGGEAVGDLCGFAADVSVAPEAEHVKRQSFSLQITKIPERRSSAQAEDRYSIRRLVDGTGILKGARGPLEGSVQDR